MGEAADFCVGLLDDSQTARMVTRRLVARAGYKTIELDDFDQLAEVIDQLDVVLLDLSLGASDGRDVAARLRALSPKGAALPVVAVTAFAGPGLKESLLEAGFVDYLHKPFRPEELYAILERCRVR